MSLQMSQADLKNLVDKAVKEGVAAALAGSGAPKQPESEADRFLREGSDLAMSPWTILAEYYANPRTPPPRAPRDPGNAFNGRAWESMAQMIEAENQARARKD